MSKVNGTTLTWWSLAALLVSHAPGLGGCEAAPAAPTRTEDLRGWVGYTSEEYPPLACPDLHAVRGVDCSGKYCDNIALYCDFIGRRTDEHVWLPYFSEDGAGPADEGHCTGASVWMTGIACHGESCDNIGMRCSRLLGTSTGTCTWSDWYSDESPAFKAPLGRFIKGIECNSRACDNKRYEYCWMY